MKSIQSQINEQIAGLYVAFFDRAPDQAGLNYWYNQATDGGDDFTNPDFIYDIAEGFATHPVFSIYDDLNDEEFVKAIYQNLLDGVDDDQSAIDYWVQHVQEHGRAHMVAEFVKAVLTYDGDDADGIARQQYFQNKVDVGLQFAAILGEDSNPTSTTNVENDPAYIASQEILSNVVDEESRDAAIEYLQTHPTLEEWANNAPTIDPVEAVVLDEDTSANGQAVAHDIDNPFAGQELTFTLSSAAANGTVEVNSDGTFTYTPYANFNGEDSFELAVSDGEGGTATTTVNVTVAPVNDAPVAQASSVTLEEDSSIDAQVQATDVDGDELAYSVSVDAEHGTVSMNPDGTFTYTPDENYNGTDTFTYSVTDGVETATETVDVTVNAVNDAPVATDASVSTDEDTVATGTIVASDVDGDTLSYAVTGVASNGTATVDANGNFTYTPNADFNGADSFEVTVTDPSGATATSTISVNVTAVNDAPVAQASSVTLEEDSSIDAQVQATDVDGDELAYSVSVDAEHGTVSMNPDGTFTYTPDENYNGTDTFTYSVTDGEATDTAEVSVTVTPDTPTYEITSLEDSVLEGSDMTFAVVASEPVDTDTVVTFTVQPGRVDAPDSGTVFTNDNDFDADVLKSVDVVIPAGETTALFTVAALLDDIQEESELYTIKASVDGQEVYASVELTDMQSSCTFALTSDVDVQTAVVFNARPAYTPGGNDLVNTLQDEDVLTGDTDGAACDGPTTLNVVLGGTNDNSEGMVAPTLNNIEVVNAEINHDLAGINYQKTTGVKEININAITTDDSEVSMINIQESTTTLSVANSTTNGDVLFNYQEGELEGTNDSVTLNLKGVRQDSLILDQGDASAHDNTEDENYGIEHLTVNVEDRSTNIDMFMVEANAMEDRYHGTEQDVTFNVHKNLEINQLIAKGAEDITINTDEGTLTEVTLDENPNKDGFNNKGLDLDKAMVADDPATEANEYAKAVQTEEMEHMTITGGGKVVLNGVTGNADNDEDYFDENVIIDGSSMTETSTLAIRVDDNVAGDRGSVLMSGKGTDEVITTTTTRMTIDTSDGADMVRIGTNAPAASLPANADATVMTGAGADRVEVQGDINATMDTSASATSTTVDGVNDGDQVYAHNLNASLTTGAGADHIEVISVTSNASISTGTEDDYVRTGWLPGELANSSDSYVGNGDVDGDIDLSTGSDKLYIYGELNANVTAGSNEETGNENGQDYVFVEKGMSSTATITTQAGDDQVSVYNSIDFDEDTYVMSNGKSVAVAGHHDVAINTGVGADVIYVKGDANRAIIAGVDGETASDSDKVTVAGNLGGYADIDTNAGDDIVNVRVLGVDDADDMSRDGISKTNNTTGVTTETDVDKTINEKGSGKVEGDADIDKTNAADIHTGAGDDTVTAYYLESAGQYNDHTIKSNGNVDDTVTIVGASIVTESGKDTVNLTQTANVALMAEQTLVDTGSEDDVVNARVYTGVVLEADNAKADRLLEREGSTPTNLDSLGAKIALGSGDDTLNINNDEKSDIDDEWIGVVDKGAVIDGEDGNDTLTIKTVDMLDTVNSKTYHNENTQVHSDNSHLATLAKMNDNNTLDTIAGQGGHIKGIETINLTIADSIDANEVATENVDVDRNGIVSGSEIRYVANDDTHEDKLGFMRLDVEQVDEALKTINLTSEEVRHEIADQVELKTVTHSTAPAESDSTTVDPAIENGFVAGEITSFEVQNFRDDANIELNLSANETAVSNTLTVKHGYVAGVGTDIADDCKTDVNVMVNMDAERTIRVTADDTRSDINTLINNINENRIFTINLEKPVDDGNDYTAEDANYDVSLRSVNTYIDMDDHSDYTSDEIDTRYARDIVINVNTGASNVVDMFNTYGNVEDSVYSLYHKDNTTGKYEYIDTVEAVSSVDAKNMVDADVDYVTTAKEVVTSLTVNGTTAGEQFVVKNVSADNISVDAGTAAGTVADAFVSVREDNAYNITTGGGDDVLDMRNDRLVYGDGIQDNVVSIINDDDKLDGGAGTDTLLIAGGQDIVAGLFAHNIRNIEKLEVNFVEDQDALSNLDIDSRYLDEVIITNINENGSSAGIADINDITIGEHIVNFDIYTDTLHKVDDSLIINANIDNTGDRENVCNPNEDNSIHSSELELNINAVDTDLDIRVNVAEGTRINLAADQDRTVEVRATVSSIADTNIGGVDATDSDTTIVNNGGDEEGELQITSANGALDKITLIGEKAGGDNGTLGQVEVADAGQHSVRLVVDDAWATDALEIDASDIGAKMSDYDSHISPTTMNDNLFSGFKENNAELTIKATNDADWIIDGQGDDTIYANAGHDIIYNMAAGYDVIDGGSGSDFISGGLNGDILIGDGYDYVNGVKEDAIQGGYDVFGFGNQRHMSDGSAVPAITTFSDFFNYRGGTAQDAIDDSNAGNNGANADRIIDFKTGEDSIYIHLGKLLNGDNNDDYVNLSSFSKVNNPSDGDDTLAGTDLKPVVGDTYYSSEAGNEKFVMDVDGNGDITTNDITIMSANEINASDIIVQLDSGDGNDTVRLGQSIDRISTGDGDDNLVIVGSIDDAQKANYLADYQDDLVMNTIEDYNLGDVVDVNEIITNRTETEANVNRKILDHTISDRIDGGNGNDTLHTFGVVDLTGIYIQNVQNIVAHSDVTMTNSQFDAFETIIFDGNTSHILTVTNYDGAYNGVVVTNGSKVVFNGTEYDTSDANELADFKTALGTTKVYNSVADLYAAYPFAIDEVNDSNPTDNNHELNDINIATGDVNVSGTSHPGAYVTVTAENGEIAEAQADRDGNWTVTFKASQLEGIEDDHFTFDAEAEGVLGSKSSDVRHATQVEVAIDTVAPTIETISIDDGGDEWVNAAEDGALTVSGTTTDVEDNQEVSVKLEDEHGHSVTVTATVTANAWTTSAVDISGFTSGDKITATANVSDKAGNPAEAKQDTSNLDNVNPTLEISFNDTGVKDGVETQDSTISIDKEEDADSGVDSITYSINGTVKTATEISNLPDGDYTGATNNIDVTLTDKAGNTTTKSIDLIKDTVAPVTVLSLHSDTGNSATDLISNEGNVDAAITETNSVESTTYTVKLNGTVKLSNASKADVDNYFDNIDATSGANDATDDGAYTIVATTTDKAGNTADSEEFKFTLDSYVAAPAAPDLHSDSDEGQSNTDNITNDNTPGFRGAAGSVEAGAKIEIKSDKDGVLGTTTANADGSWSFEVANDDALQEGEHQITVKQTDIAGNESGASTVLKIVIDTQAPAAPTIALHKDTWDGSTGGADTDGRTSDATVDVSGLETDATWEYSLDGGTTWHTGSGSSFELKTDSSVEYIQYDAGKVQVRQTDVAGNESDIGSNGAVWKTDVTADYDNDLDMVVTADEYINDAEDNSVHFDITGEDTDYSGGHLYFYVDNNNAHDYAHNADADNEDMSGYNQGDVTAKYEIQDETGNKKTVIAHFKDGSYDASSSEHDSIAPTRVGDSDDSQDGGTVFSGNTKVDIEGHNVTGNGGTISGTSIEDNIITFFSEDIKIIDNTKLHLIESSDNNGDGVTDLPGTWDVNGDELVFNPDANLYDESDYTYKIEDDAITDLAGNAFSAVDIDFTA